MFENARHPFLIHRSMRTHLRFVLPFPGGPEMRIYSPSVRFSVSGSPSNTFHESGSRVSVGTTIAAIAVRGSVSNDERKWTRSVRLGVGVGEGNGVPCAWYVS